MSNVRQRERGPSDLDYHHDLYTIENNLDIIVSHGTKYIGQTHKAYMLCETLETCIYTAIKKVKDADRISVVGYESSKTRYNLQMDAIRNMETILHALEEIRFTGHYYGKDGDSLAKRFKVRLSFVDETSKLVKKEIDNMVKWKNKTRKQYFAWEEKELKNKPHIDRYKGF